MIKILFCLCCHCSACLSVLFRTTLECLCWYILLFCVLCCALCFILYIFYISIMIHRNTEHHYLIISEFSVLLFTWTLMSFGLICTLSDLHTSLSPVASHAGNTWNDRKHFEFSFFLHHILHSLSFVIKTAETFDCWKNFCEFNLIVALIPGKEKFHIWLLTQTFAWTYEGLPAHELSDSLIIQSRSCVFFIASIKSL